MVQLVRNRISCAQLADLTGRHGRADVSDVSAACQNRSVASTEQQSSKARKRPDWSFVVAMVAAAAAVGSTLVSAYATRGSLSSTQQQLAQSEQVAVTERFARSTEQLGANTADVRIGAIFSLGRLASDSPADRPAIQQVLAAFVRQHSHKDLTETGRRSVARYLPAVDVAAAMGVLSSQSMKMDAARIDFGRTHFSGEELSTRDLSHTHLYGADLTYAGLYGTNLSDSVLVAARLDHADLRGADLTAATFYDGHFGVSFQGANLSGANLTDAVLADANLRGATLRGTILRGADLRRTQLAGAVLTGAIVDRKTLLPAGLRVP